MRAIDGGFLAILFFFALEGPASASLIGDTVTDGTSSAVISNSAVEFAGTTSDGYDFTADFNGNSLTLSTQLHPGVLVYALGSSFTFHFNDVELGAVRYLSGTLPPLLPPSALPDPCGGITDPNTYCTGFVDAIPQLDFAAATIDDPHSFTVSLGDLILGPNSVTFAIDPVPEPSSLLLLLAGLAGLGAFQWRRRRVARL